MEWALVAVWLVAYAALGAAGLPVAARLFARFPGGGAGFALPVALVLLTTGAYWVGHLTYGPIAVGAGVLLTGAAALGAGLDRAALREGRIEPAVSVDRDGISEVAAVFVVAFLLLVAVRAVDPAVHPAGGEKFLDFGLLQSLARADALPPEDVWSAGEPVSYYYGGHLVASALSHLTATPPRYAYNLALAGFYATLVAAAYDLAGAVAPARGVDRRLAGATAAFAVGLASNLVTAARLAVLALPGSLRGAVVTAVAASTQYSAGDLREGLQSFSYWDASRVLPGTINEFPLFAWLNGDLHAHMMGTPFLLLGAALAYSYYLTPEGDRRRRQLLAFGALPVVAGLQAVVDTWSFPTLFGLLWLAATFAPADPASLLPGARPESALSPVGAELRRPAAGLAVAGVAAVPAVLLAAPFLLAAEGSREVALLPASARAGFGSLALVHGAFVVAFLGYLLRRLDADRIAPLLVGVGALAVVANSHAPVALVAGPLLVLGWVALRADRPVGFETVLIVGGAGLVALVEFVYVRELAGPLRLNTVFKTYAQVWVLWGVAAGVALPGLARGPSLDGLSPRVSGRITRPRADQVGAVLAVVLIVATAPYAALALSAHFDGAADPTLDATAFVERAHPGEAPAIRYLDGIEGQPAMVSAPATTGAPGPAVSDPTTPGMYTWGSSPAASLTGVPTVAGWAHEIGYRGRGPYLRRVGHVDAIYVGDHARRVELLRRYGVEYVWVGPAEHDRYENPGAPFDRLRGAEPVVETETVTLYRIDRDRLPDR